MSDETRGREDAAQDAEACAEALESLDRIALDEVTFDETFVDMQDEPRADALALADTEQSASDDAEAVADDTGEHVAGSDGADPNDDAEEADDTPVDDADATFQPKSEANDQTNPDSGEETTLLSGLPTDDSLTRELPGLGSAPAVDETIAMAIFPCRPFPRHAKPRLAITRCRPSDAI